MRKDKEEVQKFIERKMTAEDKVLKVIPDAEPHMGMCGWGIHSATRGTLTVAAPTLPVAWNRAAKSLPAEDTN